MDYSAWDPHRQGLEDDLSVVIVGAESKYIAPTAIQSDGLSQENYSYISPSNKLNESSLFSTNANVVGEPLSAPSFVISLFSHIDKQWKFAEVIVVIVVSAILNLVTIIGNIMVLISFKMDRSLQTVSNYFLLSLALADLLIGLISMPLYTLYLLLNYWPLGPLMCDIWLAIDYLNSNAAVLNMLIISFDRYFSVTRPLTYRAKRTTKHACLMISCAWILSLTIWTPAIFFYPYTNGRTVQGTDKCEIEFVKANTYLTFVTAILAFYIPVIIMIYLYWRIWLETKKRYRDLTTLFLVSGVGAAAPARPTRPPQALHPVSVVGSSGGAGAPLTLTSTSTPAPTPTPTPTPQIMNNSVSANSANTIQTIAAAMSSVPAAAGGNYTGANKQTSGLLSSSSSQATASIHHHHQQQQQQQANRQASHSYTNNRHNNDKSHPASSASGQFKQSKEQSQDNVSILIDTKQQRFGSGAATNNTNKQPADDISILCVVPDADCNEMRYQTYFPKLDKQQSPNHSNNSNHNMIIKCKCPYCPKIVKNCRVKKCSPKMCQLMMSTTKQAACCNLKQQQQNHFFVDCLKCQQLAQLSCRMKTTKPEVDKKSLFHEEESTNGGKLSSCLICRHSRNPGSSFYSCDNNCYITGRRGSFKKRSSPSSSKATKINLADNNSNSKDDKKQSPLLEQQQTNDLHDLKSKPNKYHHHHHGPNHHHHHHLHYHPYPKLVTTNGHHHHHNNHHHQGNQNHHHHHHHHHRNSPATNEQRHLSLAKCSNHKQLACSCQNNDNNNQKGSSASNIPTTNNSNFLDNKEKQQQTLNGYLDRQQVKKLSLITSGYQILSNNSKTLSCASILRKVHPTNVLANTDADGTPMPPSTPEPLSSNLSKPLDDGKQTSISCISLPPMLKNSNEETFFDLDRCRNKEENDNIISTKTKTVVDTATSPIQFSSSPSLISDECCENYDKDYETRIVSSGNKFRFESDDLSGLSPIPGGGGLITNCQKTKSCKKSLSSKNNNNTICGLKFREPIYSIKSTSCRQCQITPINHHNQNMINCNCCSEALTIHDADCRMCRPKLNTGNKHYNVNNKSLGQQTEQEAETIIMKGVNGTGGEANTGQIKTPQTTVVVQQSNIIDQTRFPILGALVAADDNNINNNNNNNNDNNHIDKRLTAFNEDVMIKQSSKTNQKLKAIGNSFESETNQEADVVKNSKSKDVGKMAKKKPKKFSQKLTFSDILVDDYRPQGASRNSRYGQRNTFDGNNNNYNNNVSKENFGRFNIEFDRRSNNNDNNRPLNSIEFDEANYPIDDGDNQLANSNMRERRNFFAQIVGYLSRFKCLLFFCPFLKNYLVDNNNNNNNDRLMSLKNRHNVEKKIKEARTMQKVDNGTMLRALCCGSAIRINNNQTRSKKRLSSNESISNKNSSSEDSESNHHHSRYSNNQSNSTKPFYSSHHPIQPKSERKAAKTLSTLLLVFIVTWLPYNVLVLIKTLSGGEDQVPEKVWNFSYYLCYINSTINPLCYALCNAQFRRTYMRILKCKLSNDPQNSTRRLVPLQSSTTWNKDLRTITTSDITSGQAAMSNPNNNGCNSRQCYNNNRS